MTGARGNQNRAIAVAIRGLVAAFLDAHGHEVSAKPYARRISEALDGALAPDVAGIPGVHLDVSSRLQHRLSDDLDSAVRAAKINGDQLAVLVQYRPDRDVGQAYAICTLADMSKLLHAADAAP